jgi:hypothetical protein
METTKELIEAAERGDDLKDIALGCVAHAIEVADTIDSQDDRIDPLFMMANVFMMGYVGEQLQAINESIRLAHDLTID